MNDYRTGIQMDGNKILGIIIRKKDILHLLYTIAGMMEKLHYL